MTKHNAQKYPKNSITIYKGGYFGHVRIYSRCAWFDDAEYCVTEDLGGCLVIKKCYLDIPNKALKVGNDGRMQFESEIPLGNYAIDQEESDEDELVIYYS